MSDVDDLNRMLEEPDDRDYTRYPDKNIGCYICEACDRCYDAFMDHAIYCNNYATWDKRDFRGGRE